MEEEKSKLDKFAEGCERTGSKLQKMGCALTLLITLPIAGVIFFGPLGLVIGIVIGALGLMGIFAGK